LNRESDVPFIVHNQMGQGSERNRTVRAEPVLIRSGRILLFVHLVVSPILFIRGTISSFEHPKALWLTMTAVLLLFGGIATKVGSPTQQEVGRENAKKIWSSMNSYDLLPLGILLFLVSAFCSTLLSISWVTSLYGDHDNFAGLITIASYTILFFGTRYLCRELKTCRNLLMAVVFGFVCVVIYGVIQSIGIDPFDWHGKAGFGHIMRIASTMGHPNNMGGYLIMSLPVVGSFRVDALERGSFLKGLVLMMAELFASGLIALSFSRGAWAALLAMLLVFTMGMALSTAKKRVILWTVAPWIIGFALGAIYSPSSMASLTEVIKGANAPQEAQHQPPALQAGETPHLFLERIKQMRLSDLTHEARWPIWTTAFAIFLNHPFFGVGLDCFRFAFEQSRTVDQWLLEWGGTPSRAHNEALNILATQGGVGAIAVLMITVGVVFSFFRAFRMSLPDPIFPVAIFAGMSGFYLHIFLHFVVVGLGTLFITFAAILSRLNEHAPQQIDPETDILQSPPSTQSLLSDNRFIPLAIWAVAGLTLFTLVYKPLRASALAHTFFDDSLPPRTVITNMEEAVQLDPNMDIYFKYIGSAYRDLARHSRVNPSLRKEILISAKASINRAIDLVPINSYHYIDLSTLLATMAKESPPLASTEEVYSAIEKAMMLNPKDANFYLIGIQIAIALGNTQRAHFWAVESISLYPNFAPPHAQLGLIALNDAVDPARDNRHTERKKLAQTAIDHLDRSLPLFWANHAREMEIARKNLAKAYLVRADAEEQLSEFDNADASYRHLLDMQPDHEEGKQAFKEFRKRTESRNISKK